MGSIRARRYKDGGVRWFIDYVDGAGVRRRDVIKVPGEDGRRLARQILQKKEAEAALGIHGMRRGESPRFSIYAQDWMRRKTPHVKPKTVESYEGAIARLLPQFGEMRIGMLSTEDIEDFKTELYEKGVRRSKYGKPRRLAPKTINITLVVLKQILSEATALKKISVNPAAGVKPLPLHRADEGADGEVRHLEPEQLDRLLDVAEQPWRTLWLLMARTGLRRGETLGVQWDDIDFENSELHVRRSIQRVRRADRKGYEVRVSDLKTKYSRRVVPLSPDLVQALQDLPAGDDPEQPWVFRSQVDTPIDPDGVDRAFKRHLALARLPGFVRVHDLRHTAASHLLAAGIPMKTVQAIMGHASFRTTADTYGHLLSSSLDGVGERLQAFLQQGTARAQRLNGEASSRRDLRKTAIAVEIAGVTDGT